MKKFILLMSVCLLVLCLGVGLTACDGTNGDNGGASGDNSDSGSGEDSGALPPNTTVITVGQTFEKYGITITLDDVWVSTYTKTNPERLPAGSVFLFPHFTITNMNAGYEGMSNTSITRLTFSSIGGCVGYIGDTEYKRPMDALYSYPNLGKETQMDTYVNYGETVKCYNGFIVPETWTTIEFIVNHIRPDPMVPDALDFKYVVDNQ